jgi:hypothetical protein
MIWYLIGAALGVVYLGLCVWFVFEVVTAPLVDEAGRAVSDPHHRMSGRWWPNWYRRRLSRAREMAGAASPPTDTEHIGS